MIRSGLAGALLLLSATAARSEMSAKEAIQQVQAGDVSPVYFLSGLGTGFSWANTALQLDNKPRLYCVPAKIALTADQEFDVLRRYVEGNPAFADKPVGAVLLFALRDAFPCR
jgi:hypothetical protein